MPKLVRFVAQGQPVIGGHNRAVGVVQVAIHRWDRRGAPVR
jgi:hypothetical protein